MESLTCAAFAAGEEEEEDAAAVDFWFHSPMRPEVLPLRTVRGWGRPPPPPLLLILKVFSNNQYYIHDRFFRAPSLPNTLTTTA